MLSRMTPHEYAEYAQVDPATVYRRIARSRDATYSGRGPVIPRGTADSIGPDGVAYELVGPHETVLHVDHRRHPAPGQQVAS